MLDMLRAAVAAYTDTAMRLLETFGIGASEPIGDGKLTDTIIAGIFTAILAGLAYLGRGALTALFATIEEKRKFRSAQIRYIFDAEIWMRDLEKKFSPSEARKLLRRLLAGPGDFRFSLASSKEGDSDEVMQFIHWLDPREIFAIRRFLTYGELFDGMCDLISSNAFATIETDRKLTGLVKTIETGVDAYQYAEASLSTLGGRRRSILRRYLAKLAGFLFRIAVYDDREYLRPPKEPGDDLRRRPAHGWTAYELQSFEEDARAALKERRQRL